MAQNDVSMSDVYGTNAGVYDCDAIPSAITSLTGQKCVIIVLDEAITKANGTSFNFFNTPVDESQFDTATDFIFLNTCCNYAFSALNAKGEPSYSLRKFDTLYFGKSLNSNQFESGKDFNVQSFQTAIYRETTALSNTYDLSTNTLT